MRSSSTSFCGSPLVLRLFDAPDFGVEAEKRHDVEHRVDGKVCDIVRGFNAELNGNGTQYPVGRQVDGVVAVNDLLMRGEGIFSGGPNR
jgi:hypothetical protein